MQGTHTVQCATRKQGNHTMQCATEQQVYTQYAAYLLQAMADSSVGGSGVPRPYGRFIAGDVKTLVRPESTLN